ncbi:MAG: NAD-dependent succinate-semialdehyde dehydrogenase [Betaproteobacteria bacterium]|nr:MAG: NAD-dependent succinate-semialdehyde dehydrogenase [Betaproteobacteria bacterium]
MPATYQAPFLVIGAELASGSSGAPIINPATEQALGAVPTASREDLDRALAAAARGFDIWRRTAPDRREQLMVDAARLMRQRAAEIACTITLEQGKPLNEAGAEVSRAAELLEWNAHEGRRTYGRIVPGPARMRQMVLREPIGPVAGFTPWNSPSSSPSRKIGGALAAGCSIILKAAEETPGGAYAFVRCFLDAGVPEGVVNLVFGNPAEIAEYLITSPVVRAITFTGSVSVGKHLAALAAARMKPALMELGGHAPVIVCADADPERSARLSVAAKFRNAGQVCISPTRFIVHERVYQRFVETFTSVAGALHVGDGMEDGVQMGPLLAARRIQAMESLVEDSLARGARIASGGKRLERRGFFFAPTVLTGVPTDAQVMTVEPFGPIAPIVPFQELREAIRLANSLPLGLAAYAFTESGAAAGVLADDLEVGHLSINHFGAGLPESPFGGVKDSGIGREGGLESLDGFMVTKFVSHGYAA